MIMTIINCLLSGFVTISTSTVQHGELLQITWFSKISAHFIPNVIYCKYECHGGKGTIWCVNLSSTLCFRCSKKKYCPYESGAQRLHGSCCIIVTFSNTSDFLLFYSPCFITKNRDTRLPRHSRYHREMGEDWKLGYSVQAFRCCWLIWTLNVVLTVRCTLMILVLDMYTPCFFSLLSQCFLNAFSVLTWKNIYMHLK